MTRSIIIDTSPLVAFIDKSDDFHNWTIEVWKTIPIPLLTCEAVITEACFLLQNIYGGEYKGLRLYADLGAEKLFAAEKYQEKILIEIKVFNHPSLITELEKTLGQYNIYKSLIKRIEPKRKLYLAISEDVYQDFFQRPAIQDILSDYNISYLIFDPNQEVIIQWIN